jgi:hypothetical protein
MGPRVSKRVAPRLTAQRAPATSDECALPPRLGARRSPEGAARVQRRQEPWTFAKARYMPGPTRAPNLSPCAFSGSQSKTYRPASSKYKLPGLNRTHTFKNPS